MPRNHGRKKTRRICLCSPPGISFGYPEPEFVRIATYLLQKGHEVIVYDLKIELYCRIKNLLTKALRLEAHRPKSPAMFSRRARTEVINGPMQEYLFIAAAKIMLDWREDAPFRLFPLSGEALQCIMGLLPGNNEKFPEGMAEGEMRSRTFEKIREIAGSHFDLDDALLDRVLVMLREEFTLFIDRVRKHEPDLLCFFISPREIREVSKKYWQMDIGELLYPFLLSNEITPLVKASMLLACETRLEFFPERYWWLADKTPLKMFVYDALSSAIEAHVTSPDSEKKKPGNIPGTIYYDKKQLHRAPPSQDAQCYTIPDYSLVSLYLYHESSLPPHGILVDGSTGCPLECAFCNVGEMYGPFRLRSAEDLAEELFFHQERLGLGTIFFNDRIFNGDIARLKAFCGLLIDGHYEGQWSCYGAIRPEMDNEILARMKASGCFAVSYGVESGSSMVLSMMSKNYGPELAAKVIRETSRCGIMVELELMTDFPGENDADFEATLAFLKENFPFINGIRLNQFECLRGSDVYAHPSRYGLREEERFKKFEESGRLRRLKEYVAELEGSAKGRT
jgi:radical SAM superfamily enzyme YgiQ (UPF0313 family)